MVKLKYEGQALAIVLIVLIVAVIIALAVVSRTLSDRTQVIKERSSADAVEAANSTLDAVAGISIADLAEYAEGTGRTVCGLGPTDNFADVGCHIESVDDLETLLDNFGLSAFYDSISNDLAAKCPATDSNQFNKSLNLSFEYASEDDEITIEKDSVFSIVNNGNPPNNNPGTCAIDLNATPLPSGSTAGVITSAVYVTKSGNDIASFKQYRYPDVKAFCISDGCNGSADWVESSNSSWGLRLTGNIDDVPIIKTIGSTDYYLQEVRIKPVGSDINLTRQETGGTDCVSFRDLLKVSATVNCGDTARGREIVLTDDEWAPAIFDYVVFNGNGVLELSQ
ncbi:hypothetical protein H6764_01525 [Candidatus Nomurabacteria bacterium]|nr:hypothetical protein [Candidatus Nomurabacteria bacterium]